MTSAILKFGTFELDRRNFELRSCGRRVELDRTPLELLLLLVERAGALVTHEEAVAHVWGPDVFIDAEASLYTAIRKIRRALGDNSAEPQFIQTVSRKGYRFIAKVGKAEAASPATGTFMLAVLPLQNLSGDLQQDYLADGITEEIITQLAALDPRKLRVIARTSAMRYKNTQRDVAEISRELGVDHVIEGSLRRSGTRLRVTAQLIQSSDQTHLWAKSYDRELGNVLEIESDIASEVAAAIQLTLSEPANARLAASSRVSPEAHDAYLRGLHCWHQRTREGVTQAIASFTQATELDPNYATAFAALGVVFSLAPIFSELPGLEAARLAAQAATRALELADTLADAHSALAFVRAHYEYDWPAAQRGFWRAIELEPNNASAHFFYSNSYLSPQGHHAQALAEIQQALQLDPLSTRIQSFLGRTLIWAGRYEDALSQYDKVNQLDPNFALNHQRLAQLYALLGEYANAIVEEKKARLLGGEEPGSVLAKTKRLRRALAKGGSKAYWNVQLEFSLESRNPPEAYTRPFGRAIIYSHLQDRDNAFANLELAYAKRDPQMTELPIEPQLESLRSDAQFRSLALRIGLDR